MIWTFAFSPSSTPPLPRQIEVVLEVVLEASGDVRIPVRTSRGFKSTCPSWTARARRDRKNCKYARSYIRTDVTTYCETISTCPPPSVVVVVVVVVVVAVVVDEEVAVCRFCRTARRSMRYG
jgi:hypothetical protein